MSLVDLYQDSEEMIDYFNTSIDNINQETKKWNSVLQNYLLKKCESCHNLQLPQFETGLEWVNTSRPLLEKDLIGKILIIDFFTYCCINCEHILPYLKDLEKEFAGNPSVVVIGVHSPKFPNEKDKRNVKDAVFRNNITHPVLHDAENYLWNKMGIYCWPTVLILSPSHIVLFSLFGESQIDKLSHLVNQTVQFYECKEAILNSESLPNVLTPASSSLLLYPSNITYCGNSRLIVSDTGHHRLIVITLQGDILNIIGNKKSGYKDGSYSEALFNCPRGTAWLQPDKVFVADTGNHCIRLIDLVSKSVLTVFDGRTCENNSAPDQAKEESEQKFSSPWDLCIGPKLGAPLDLMNVLYIAVAGSHQIWALNLTDFEISKNECIFEKCVPFAGNGKEECRNNLYKMKAGFAQPSGVSYNASCPEVLFIADSESSTIRSISLKSGAVTKIVGGSLNPLDLFNFGDVDGKGLNVKLQHPLGVCVVNEEKIYVADSYNHKIKVVNSKTQECLTLTLHKDESEKSGNSSLEAFFLEPSGLCFLKESNTLLVADTNNSCLKMIDLETNIVKKLNIHYDDVDGPTVTNFQESYDSSSYCSTPIRLHPSSKRNLLFEPLPINLNADGEVHLNFTIESEGISFANDTIQPWSVSFKGECNWKVSCSGSLFQQNIQPSVILKCLSSSEIAKSEVEIDVNINACDNVKKTCFAREAKIILSIKASNSGCKVFCLNIIV